MSTLSEWIKTCVELEELCNQLKAEVARLRASSFVTAVPVEHYERVVKAGDEMADRLMYQGYPETVPAWLAAKEGKPSV